MRKFKFALERVLKILRSAEDVAEQGVKAASFRVQVESGRAEERQRELEGVLRAQCAWVRARSGELQASDMALSHLFVQRARSRKLEAVEKVRAAVNERARRLGEYRECRTRRKAVEVLRQRRLKKHLQMWAREYQAFLDETVASKSVRGNDDD